jgi:peptidoglycan/LPS O-acetylase OafA/YrhL
MPDGPVRNHAVDFYRVSGVVLIVLGHWLAGAVTYRDGAFGRQNPLVDQPWTQWLTWPLQAVPAFFLVAGYAAAVSWSHRCATEGVSRQTWLRHRLARVLGPSAVCVGRCRCL